MDNILQQGEIGLLQDFLIYGKEYHIWRNKKYLGVATYTDDPNLGDSFLKNSKTEEGEDCFEVYVGNEWKFN